MVSEYENVLRKLMNGPLHYYDETTYQPEEELEFYARDAKQYYTETSNNNNQSPSQSRKTKS